jgi:hypothetical protein
MAHLNKRKHVKHLHVHAHRPEAPPHHERHPAASFLELGRALVHRVVYRLTRPPRRLFAKLTGLYARATA